MLLYSLINCRGSSGSRMTLSKSTTASKAPLVRMKRFKACLMASTASVALPNGVERAADDLDTVRVRAFDHLLHSANQIVRRQGGSPAVAPPRPARFISLMPSRIISHLTPD